MSGTFPQTCAVVQIHFVEFQLWKATSITLSCNQGKQKYLEKLLDLPTFQRIWSGLVHALFSPGELDKYWENQKLRDVVLLAQGRLDIWEFRLNDLVWKTKIKWEYSITITLIFNEKYQQISRFFAFEIFLPHLDCAFSLVAVF